jgi:hypothetical protein
MRTVVQGIVLLWTMVIVSCVPVSPTQVQPDDGFWGVQSSSSDLEIKIFMLSIRAVHEQDPKIQDLFCAETPNLWKEVLASRLENTSELIGLLFNISQNLNCPQVLFYRT